MSPPSNHPPPNGSVPGQPASSPLTTQEMQELTALRREKAAMASMMWNLVALVAPETHVAEVHPNPSDPLWQLVFARSSDASSGRVRILAGSIKPITESEKKRVVRMLRGTAMPMDVALKELKLDQFPPSYVEKQIEKHLVWLPDGLWESVAQPSIAEKAKSFLGLKKS